ncbi:ERI1 exoribonuclease member 3 [Steccherinum ochraceum]|uniref:Phosphatidylglycerol/phosphatidylinositol transfer protein n=1 Tax=Steccherinum ochraceum TaxID=92696 RepID=A0A4R0R5A6_9APHY|nr:ERI1 exoribonuclease member 3 [Steccherinum ochraceum]
MARFAILSVLVAALASAASALPPQEPLQQLSDKWTWKDCGSSGFPLHVESIEITPDPPRPGEDLTVTAKGVADITIEDGAYAEVAVKVGRIKILQKEFNLCEEALKANASIQCPVSEGDHEITHTVALPKEIPPAPFNVHIDGYTVDDEDLLCLDLSIDFRKSRFFGLSRAMSSTGVQPKYLLVLDFEATCGDGIRRPEIIEFPTLLYNVNEDKVEATFHEYVRPVEEPKLTQFCTDLTGIQQDTVDAADAFPDVWERFQAFLKEHGVYDKPTEYSFITCGNWDLKTMLPKQLELSESAHGLDASGVLIPPYNDWINLKAAFRRHRKSRHENGMAAMLKVLKLELEGRHHSGIDDCKNILRIIQELKKQGWAPVKGVRQ